MRLRTRDRWVAMVAALTVVAAGLVAAPIGEERAEAASASQFDPGNLISDSNFFQGEAMTDAQVQTFLQQRRPTCDAGYTCLPGYRQATPAMAATAYCNAMDGRADESAASIIARVGAACDISQRVLLVLLEKEQSLVTDANPTQRQYDRATGFACPDTAPCDPAFGGFFYQVYNAARQFQRYAAHPANYNHQANAWNTVLYNPIASCGSSPVYIANAATAGLYNYTPYQPNAAALANLYGTGDACSAYGNRNFWRIYSDWFGDPREPAPSDPSPIVRVEALGSTPTTVRVEGWALDRETDDPIDVHVYVDGRGSGIFYADLSRPDVEQLMGAGARHGFDITVPVTPGQHEICLAAINVGEGQNTWSCQAFHTPTGSPFGNVESATVVGRDLVVTGWAIDPDVASSIGVHAYINGSTWGGSTVADLQRTDVGRVHSGYGNAHGFTLTVPMPVGTNDVSVAFVNVGGGQNLWPLKREVRLESGPPFGNFESVTALPQGVRIGGWAIDPDTAAPVDMHVYIDGRGYGAIRADLSRPDVARAMPGYGDAHGYSATFSGLGFGSHEVCVAAINLKYGQNTWFCRTVALPTGAPFGNLESVRVEGELASFSGWTIDPDTANPIDVHVYVNGAWGTRAVASLVRDDVARLNPNYGAQHGFSGQVAIPVGTSQVCVAAINVGGGQNRWFDCVRVVR
jgi:hypothetical protein